MASSLEHAQEVATNHKNSMDELERKLQNSDFVKERMNNERNEARLLLDLPQVDLELYYVFTIVGYSSCRLNFDQGKKNDIQHHS